MSGVRRIAITGGPGSGQDHAVAHARRGHPERVLAVPEVACAMDRRLRDVRSAHRKFAFIPCQSDFSAKIADGCRALLAAIDG